MSDLISREAAIDVLKQTGIIQDNDRGHLVVDEINRIPTAYVIDNVIREIDDDIAYIEADDGTKGKFVHFEGVVNAIRKGGLEYE